MSGSIVVGVDGSGGSAAALRWAAEEARHRKATLRAVYVWHYPVPVGLPYADVQAVAGVDFVRHAHGVLDDAIADVLGEDPSIPLERVVRQGAVSDQLLDVARDADLLVVGSRGHGGFTGLLLGSVSQQCVTHATCPTVVVPPPSGS